MSFTRRILFSLMSRLTDSSGEAEHSFLYNEFPNGWASERKVHGLKLWWIALDTGHWSLYSSHQWFRMGQSDVIPFSISFGKALFMVEDF